MIKNTLIAATMVIIGAVGALLYLNVKPSDRSADADPQVLFCDRHQITENECPWCDSSLVEKLGMCSGHGVPEALCSRCNPALIPGFKAEGDWCAGHSVPESQCALCRGGEPTPKTTPSFEEEFCVRHQMDENECPWCDSSLVEKKGICPGHGVPEALCSRCNPALIPGFKAEGDWCAGHSVPESQCTVCRGEENESGEAS